MAVVIVKVKLQANLCFLPFRCSFIVMFALSFNSLHQNTRPIKILVWGLGLLMGAVF